MAGILQRIQSIFFPVKIRAGSSAFNDSLKLLLFRGRYMLATSDAIYSDGTKYRPLLAAFARPELKPKLFGLRNVLVLGTGLASAVHILEQRGARPDYTLVEIDKTVLDWALEFLPGGSRERVRAVRSDAFDFIGSETARYDLIIVDIFFGRSVPDGVAERVFLERCRERLMRGGVLVLNYMLAPENHPQKVKAALEATFGSVEELSFGLNRVYLAATA